MHCAGAALWHERLSLFAVVKRRAFKWVRLAASVADARRRARTTASAPTPESGGYAQRGPRVKTGVFAIGSHVTTRIG
jgi:hypothetical protein